MFVAWRDLRVAKGRFVLMGAVVVLMTLLVTLLSGLTAGLGRESTSAIADLPADHLAFAGPGDRDVSFSDSVVQPEQWREWSREPGISSATPLGIATSKAVVGGRSIAVSVFGVPAGSPLAPDVTSGQVVLSHDAAADLDITAGADLTVGDHRLDVAEVSGDASYSHLPVVWLALPDWQQLAPGAGHGATVIALSTTDDVDLAAVDQQLGTRTVATGDALSAIGSYTSENGSLQLMRAMLFAISALVIGAFFTVWTVQRSGDIAILKALGATTGHLLRDALGQALVLLVGGTALGAALAAGIGLAAQGVVPFTLTLATTVLPAVVMVVLGTAGAALAVRSLTTVDPLTALGSAR